MKAQEDRGAVVAKWIFGGIIELVTVGGCLSWIFSLLSSASTTLVLVGVVLLASLVAGLAYQVLHLFHRPVAKTGRIQTSKLSAIQVAVRKGPGELIKDEGIEIFVPEGENPIDDEPPMVDA